MNQQNKADNIPGRYFPCLADYTSVTLECEFRQEAQRQYTIQIHCGLAPALKHMGEYVHFILDSEDKTLYICSHKTERDGQSPLWRAIYNVHTIEYSCDARDMFGKEPFSATLMSTIEYFSEIPVERSTKHYRIRGYYSYELEALVFPLERNKIDIMPNNA